MDSVEDFLLNELDLSLKKRDYARKLIVNHYYSPTQLMTLIQNSEEKQKIRLLCFCDTFSRVCPEYFSENLQDFTDLIKNEKQETNKRSLTNIFLTYLKNKQFRFNETQEEQIIEICFLWLTDDSLVATKSNCISCLALLAKRHQWIKEELIALIEKMYPQMTVSFQSRARKILKQKRF